MVRQSSSTGRLNTVNDVSVSSADQLSTFDKAQPVSGNKGNSTQVVTAHDNGQVQVWDMSTGFLQPVLRMGVAGPSARYGLHNTLLYIGYRESIEVQGATKMDRVWIQMQDNTGTCRTMKCKHFTAAQAANSCCCVRVSKLCCPAWATSASP